MDSDLNNQMSGGFGPPLVRGARLLEVRAADVAVPAEGDSVGLDGEALRVVGDPRRVAGGRVWRCQVVAT